MADIVYKIVYDEKGFRTEQHVVAVGTKVDRVGFVTTQESEEYIPKGTRIALQRDEPKHNDPFDNSMDSTYVVPVAPVEGKGLAFFEVGEQGKAWDFHLTCGAFNKDTNQFTAFEKGHAHLVLDARPPTTGRFPNSPSLPWPG